MARAANVVANSKKAKNPYAVKEKPTPKATEEIDQNVHYERASTTLLAQQPATPEFKTLSPGKIKEWNVLRSHVEQRIMGLRNWRQSWWSTNWSDLAEFILPRRSIWLTQSTGGIPTPNNMTRGREINSAIIDPTATYAVRVCAGGLMSGLASPSRPWFKVVPSLKNVKLDSEARQWLDDVEDRVYTVLAQSNFYNSFAQECEDLVVFGTAPVLIYEDEKEIIRCYNPVIGEYYLSSSAEMRVDGVFRTFVMTVSQIVDFFGVENCSQDVQKLWQAKGNSLEVERIIGHAIEPNFGLQGTDVGKIPGNFAWRETYWLYGQGSERPLSVRGFVEQPFTAARWSTQSNDAYGRSVGMDVLPDVKQLQVMTMRMAEAIEKQVRPPLLASMEMKNQPASALPGHVTYAESIGADKGMRPIYTVQPQIDHMAKNILAIEERIKIGFFNDLFAMFSEIPGGKMTAYETAQRVQERLNRIGPVIENLITESLKPKLKRIFGIMKRKGFIDAPPDSLKGVPLDLEFVSILALAQKSAATGGLERIAAFVGNLAPVFGEAKYKLDADTLIDEMNTLLGNPDKVLRSTDEATKLYQQDLKQQQQAQQMAAAQHMAQTANIGAQAGQTLANTQIGGGQQALSAILGSG